MHSASKRAADSAVRLAGRSAFVWAAQWESRTVVPTVGWWVQYSAGWWAAEWASKRADLTALPRVVPMALQSAVPWDRQKVELSGSRSAASMAVSSGSSRVALKVGLMAVQTAA